MSGGTPDDRYLSWLHAQVADVRDRASSRSYRKLFKQLFSTEFIWTLPHDENRAVDGLALRDEWMSQMGTHPDPHWLALGCSFLEMLIGLARRLAFDQGETPEYWFWHFLSNLGLSNQLTEEEVQERVDRAIYRLYDRNGHGGLFPLQRARRDQRRVEIWYQFHEYLLQNR
jgi:hypothetical protein